MSKKPVLKVWVGTGMSNTAAIIVAAYSKTTAVQLLNYATDAKLTKREFKIFCQLIPVAELSILKFTKHLLFDRPAVYLYLLGKYCCIFLGTKED